jgi:hypothetical protein
MWVTVQNINKMQKALAKAFIPFTMCGTYSGEGANIVAMRAKSI